MHLKFSFSLKSCKTTIKVNIDSELIRRSIRDINFVFIVVVWNVMEINYMRNCDCGKLRHTYEIYYIISSCVLSWGLSCVN